MHEVPDSMIRAMASEILARREFAAIHEPNSWFDQVLLRLLKWLGKFGTLRIHSPALYWCVVAACSLLVLTLVTRTIVSIARVMNAPPRPEGFVSSSDVRDLAAESEALAAAGDHLGGAHLLMIASFHTHAARSMIELRPDRSNRWIRAALLKSSLDEKLTIEIAGLVERTEWRWFGDRRNDPAIYAQWRSAFDKLSIAC